MRVSYQCGRGKKQAQSLASKAEKTKQINQGAGEESTVLAKAKGEAIRILDGALTQHNEDAVASLIVAEQCVNAFAKLAKDSNTLLLSSIPSYVTSTGAQAMGNMWRSHHSPSARSPELQ
ncbi:stomatin-like protein 2, mitochondrial [Acomys russatus]|uniref:stomatin-like protein 2, mitochondrial n=1 Tax=Acomys russatus TaxID=60746 RepID=UPI0021E2FD83|nr:stomatin-like protein 2, mitochondrial [Acomys russatus]